jgi:hypothetical protein
MVLKVPFCDGDNVSITEDVKRGEITIQAGPHRRNISLPDSITGLSVKTAKLGTGELEIILGHLHK